MAEMINYLIQNKEVVEKFELGEVCLVGMDSVEEKNAILEVFSNSGKKIAKYWV